MPDTTQFISNRLSEWGIKRVYGYAGDGINGVIGAWHEVGHKLELRAADEGRTPTGSERRLAAAPFGGR